MPADLPHQVPGDEGVEFKDDVWNLNVQGNWTPRHLDSESELGDIDTKSEHGRCRLYIRMTFHVITLVNIVIMAVEHCFEESEEQQLTWVVTDSLFVVAFCIEIGVRMYWERSKWPCIAWNWFDIIVTLLSAIDVWLLQSMNSDSELTRAAPVLRALRLIRVVRLFKLLRYWQGLYAMVMSMTKTIKTLADVFVVLMTCFFLYATVMVTLIGRSKTFKDVKIGERTTADYFGSISTAMLTLFDLMILEGWVSVYRPLVSKQFWVFIPVSIFIVAFTFGMLNMIVAFIIDTNVESRREIDEVNEKKRLQTLREDLELLQEDSKKDGAFGGKLTYGKFEAILLSKAPVRQIFQGLGCETCNAREIFEVVDWDDTGRHTVSEFLESLLGMLTSDDTATASWHRLAANSIVKGHEWQISELENSFVTWRDVLDQHRSGMTVSLASQDEALSSLARFLDSQPGG